MYLLNRIFVNVKGTDAQSAYFAKNHDNFNVAENDLVPLIGPTHNLRYTTFTFHY